tara:strand:+ start:520 stop:744 length:225 start_codon:yes stop_codon:yes gene_type:complete
MGVDVFKTQKNKKIKKEDRACLTCKKKYKDYPDDFYKRQLTHCRPCFSKKQKAKAAALRKRDIFNLARGANESK